MAAGVAPRQQAALGGDGPAGGAAQCLSHRHSELRAGLRLLVQQPVHLLLRGNIHSFPCLLDSMFGGKRTSDDVSHLLEALVIVAHQLAQLRPQTSCLLFHSLSQRFDVRQVAPVNARAHTHTLAVT